MQFSQMLQNETQCSIKLLRNICSNKSVELKLSEHKNVDHNSQQSVCVFVCVCVNLIFERNMRERWYFFVEQKKKKKTEKTIP